MFVTQNIGHSCGLVASSFYTHSQSGISRHNPTHYELNKVALAAAAFAIPSATYAVAINVGGQCSIFQAIVSANNDSSPRGIVCRDMDQTRSICPRLTVIRSDMTINGHSSTRKRAARANSSRYSPYSDRIDKAKYARMTGAQLIRYRRQPQFVISLRDKRLESLADLYKLHRRST